MRRELIAAVVVLALAASASAERRGAVDWIFLVDTSMSMRGVGGTRDIFHDVQQSIDTFIHDANDGDSVAVYTFDRDVQLHSVTKIEGTARDDLRTIVDHLYPNGARTHLGLAIQQGLLRAVQSHGDPTRVQAVVLFTDGKEDVRGIESPVPIRSNLEHVGDAFVYFVSLGDEHEAQLDEFASLSSSRAQVIRAQDTNAIREIAQKIRATLPEPKPEAIKIVEPPPSPPEPTSPLRWLLLIPLLGAIAFALHSIQKNRNQLEGAIEILRPRVDAGSAYIGLPRLKATEISLSSILPSETLAGGDARLFVRRRDGEKRVWIAARAGALRVNDVETPEAELFDADTIELGDAKLRFNHVGHERTQEDL
jgi:Mg-chelatase subunit ChlD